MGMASRCGVAMSRPGSQGSRDETKIWFEAVTHSGVTGFRRQGPGAPKGTGIAGGGTAPATPRYTVTLRTLP